LTTAWESTARIAHSRELRGNGVSSRGFQVVEERGDGLGVDVGEVDAFSSGPSRFGEIFDEHPPGVAVGADGVGGEIALGVGEHGEV
jgi:hypothetical protein